jgi:hypothetical protein
VASDFAGTNDDSNSVHKEFSFLEINRVPSPVNGQALSAGKSSTDQGQNYIVLNKGEDAHIRNLSSELSLCAGD